MQVIKCSEKISRVPSHDDLGMVSNFIFVVKLSYKPVFQWRSHDDLHFFEKIDIGKQFFGLMLAVLTIRTKNEDQCGFFGNKICFRKPAAIRHFGHAKRWDRWKAQVNRYAVGLGKAGFNKA